MRMVDRLVDGRSKTAAGQCALLERRNALRLCGDGSAAAIPRLAHRETELVKVRLGDRPHMSLDFCTQGCAQCKLSSS